MSKAKPVTITVKKYSVDFKWDKLTLPDGSKATGYEIKINDNIIKLKSNKYKFSNAPIGDDYTVQIRAIYGNTYGEWSEIQSFAVADVTAPKMGKLNVRQISADSFQLSFAPATDNNAIKEYAIKVNGKIVAATSDTTYTYQTSTPGSKLNFEVIAIDAANLSSKPAKASCKVTDMIEPETVANIRTEGEATEKSTVLTWTAPPDNVKTTSYIIEVDGKIYKSSKNTLKLKNLSVGEHTVIVTALDKAGNKSAPSAEFTFHAKDVTAPKLGKLAIQQQSAAEVKLAVLNGSTDIAKYDFYLDGKLIGSSDDGVFIYQNDQLPASLNFSVIAVDEAGNSSKTVKSKFKVQDMTNPAQVTGLRIDGTPNGKSTTISWNSASDNVKTTVYIVTVNGKTYKSAKTSLTIKNLAAGDYTVTVKAYDKAGNYSTSSEALEFQITAAAPQPPSPPKPQPGKYNEITIGGIDSNKYEDIYEDPQYHTPPASAKFGVINGTAGNDKIIFSVNQSRSIDGLVLGSGDDQIIFNDSSSNRYECLANFGGNGKIELGDGNNYIFIGNNSYIVDFASLTSGNGNNTIEITNGGLNAAYSGSIVLGSGDDTINISGNGELEMNGGTLNLGSGNNKIIASGKHGEIDNVSSLICGDGNDVIELSDGFELELELFSSWGEAGEFITGGGNDTVKIGKGSEVALCGNLDFGNGNDKLTVDGTLILSYFYGLKPDILNLEEISGSGTVAFRCNDTAELNLSLLERFRKAGLKIVNLQNDSDGFASPEEELSDNKLSSAPWAKVDSDGEIDEHELWLCGQECANNSLYGFADPVDYVKFTKNSQLKDMSFDVDGSTENCVTIELLNAQGSVIRTYNDFYCEYDISDLKNNSTYYLKVSCASNAYANVAIYID